MVQIMIAVVVTLAIAVPITAYVSASQCRKKIELTMGNAEDKAREIIDEALKTAEAKKKGRTAGGKGRIHSYKERVG